jgi:CubicO group peptidase (beta-lactamase class C family)
VLIDDATGATRPAAGPILVRHLLTHTAGLGYSINRGTPLARRYTQAGLTPGSRSPLAPGEGAPPSSLEEFAARLAEQPLASDPGSVWTYSASLDLLGAVIERVAGKPFEEVLRDRIFSPLGMNDTAFYAGAAQAARMTSVLGVSPQGVQVVDPRSVSPFLRPASSPAGGAGLVSTAADYARFCAALLGRGEAFGARILSRKSADLAVSNLLPPGVTAEERGNAFGAGLRVVTPASVQKGEEPARSFGWGGAAGTTFWCDPTNGLGVVFMAQFFPSSAYPTAGQVRRAFYADRAG